eukprot:IDg9944t1
MALRSRYRAVPRTDGQEAPVRPGSTGSGATPSRTHFRTSDADFVHGVSRGRCIVDDNWCSLAWYELLKFILPPPQFDDRTDSILASPSPLLIRLPYRMMGPPE